MRFWKVSGIGVNGVGGGSRFLGYVWGSWYFILDVEWKDCRLVGVIVSFFVRRFWVFYLWKVFFFSEEERLGAGGY